MPSRRAAAFVLATLIFAPACGGDDTPDSRSEPATEDQTDADLVPGDPSNGIQTDPGDMAPGADVGGDGTDEEDTVED
jgi:hypothetical protein